MTRIYVRTYIRIYVYPSGKATAGIQQNDRLDQMPTKLFPSEILGDVPQRSTILVPPPSQARPLDVALAEGPNGLKNFGHYTDSSLFSHFTHHLLMYFWSSVCIYNCLPHYFSCPKKNIYIDIYYTYIRPDQFPPMRIVRVAGRRPARAPASGPYIYAYTGHIPENSVWAQRPCKQLMPI